MADERSRSVAIYLPADLVAKLEELKQDREEDRNRTVEELVRAFCHEYVAVREMARWDEEHAEEINRSYEEHPNEWDDAAFWEQEWKRTQEGQA
jgi:metal-responsive CopG/Arc/MetJ family transcriptional regulator